MGGIVTILAANVATAAILINSGTTKLVSPAGLRQAVRELMFPALRSRVTDGFVRAVASLELATAAGLLVTATRTPAIVLVALFGTGFAVLGAVGAMRGSTTACGCFGRTSNKPLGTTNIFMGLALLAVVLLNESVTTVSADYTADAMVSAALVSLLLCLWLNRRLAKELLGRPAWRHVG